jgi:hypothetical protein
VQVVEFYVSEKNSCYIIFRFLFKNNIFFGTIKRDFEIGTKKDHFDFLILNFLNIDFFSFFFSSSYNLLILSAW